MQHLVRYRLPSGEEEVHAVDSLEAALTLVERARNDLGATDVHLFREIPVEFRAYYKATVADPSVAPPGAMVSVPPPRVARAEAEEPGEGKRALFGRG